MKRIVILLMTFAMLLSAAACGTGGNKTDDNKKNDVTLTPAEIEQKIASATPISTRIGLKTAGSLT